MHVVWGVFWKEDVLAYAPSSRRTLITHTLITRISTNNLILLFYQHEKKKKNSGGTIGTQLSFDTQQNAQMDVIK